MDSIEVMIYDETVTEPGGFVVLKKFHELKGKKNKIKNTRKINFSLDLPSLPSCRHADKGFHCIELGTDDVADFQRKFYESGSKVKQDIFILRHCAVSAPKRCRSKDGIPRKSHIMHFYIPKTSSTLVTVCRKAFTEILGIRNGRVKGVITRYIESKKIPTENRGGNRQSKKFQKKFQSVHNFLSALQGILLSCNNCGAKKIALSPEQDVRKLWLFYNSKSPYELRVVESYFRNVFTKNFNICFGEPSDKDHCYKCTIKDKRSKDMKNEIFISEKEALQLKMLEMSYPPGEHFLFAPLPSNRDPITTSVWRDGDHIDQTKDNMKEKSVKVDSQCCCNPSYRHSMQSSAGEHCQGVTVGNVLQSNAADQYPNIRHHNVYLPLPEHVSQCNTFTSNQLVVTNPTFNIPYPRVENMDQSVIYGNMLLNSIIPNPGLQIPYERNDTINTGDMNNHEQIKGGSNICYSCNQQKNINVQSYHSATCESLRQDLIDSGSASKEDESVKTQSTVKKKPLYKCVPCKLTFSSENAYNAHKSGHFKKKLLNCEYCKRTFSRRDSYNHHVKSHSVKVHQCSMCSKVFSHLINLQIHSERDHNIKSMQ